MLHREDDEPAFVQGINYKSWNRYGKYHRDKRGADGKLLPAAIWSDGLELRYIDGWEQ
jgi:hypothetical protein